MASIGEVTVTATTVSVQVLGIQIGDTVRFYLYYADSSWNPTTAVMDGSGDGQYGPSTSAGGHTFTATGLKSNSRMVYTVSVTNSSGSSTTVCSREHITTGSPTPSKTWPGNWTKWDNITSWNILKPISADDYNAFLDHINKVRDYKGADAFSFIYVRSGDLLEAGTINTGASTAIRQIGGNPPSCAPGDDITPAFFKALAKSANDLR